MSRTEASGSLDSQLTDTPIVPDKYPRYSDKWSEFLQTLPPNLVFSHHRGSWSCWETLVRVTESSRLMLIGNMYARTKVQLPEDEFAEALARAKELTRVNFQVLHMRQDLETVVAENPYNAPFRDIVNHSVHKEPIYELERDEDGRWWNKYDLREAQLAATFSQLPLQNK